MSDELQAEVEQMREKNQRLRELLKRCQPYLDGWPEAKRLLSEIEKEVSDE